MLLKKILTRRARLMVVMLIPKLIAISLRDKPRIDNSRTF